MATIPVAPSKLADLVDVDLLVLPVREDEGAVLAVAVPENVAGFSVPAAFDEDYARSTGTGAGETTAIRGFGGPSLLLVGIGSGDLEGWRRFGAAATRAGRPGQHVALVVPPKDAVAQEAATLGALLATYRFDRHRSTKREGIGSITVASPSIVGLDKAVASAATTADAVAFAKDLINEPAGHLSPSEMAKRAAARLKAAKHTTVEVWEKARIEKEKLGGLLGVAQGSLEPPRLVIGRYVPEKATAKTPHIVLVGKGVTFDSGGLSLKTGAGMMTMKTDMSGAAIVLAALSACDDLGVKVKVTAIAPMTENMPSGNAVRPGDVLTARNGKTMEILNTDAEGRLILADALCLGAEMEPTVMIDVATLTGAQVVALGSEIAASYATDQALSNALFDAGEAEGEHNWPMPLPTYYRSHIDSEVADMKNIGKTGEAGSVSAALFLQEFVGETTWAHLDIAGPGRSEAESGYKTRGATAFSLRTLLTYLRSLR